MPRLALTVMAIVLIVAALCAATNQVFVTLADVDSYMAASERVLRMSKTAEDTLAAMIRDGEVTWDPTNGEKMGKVLAHLKDTDRTKILMVGSSQFLVVRDDRSETSWNRRVDRILQRLSKKPVEVYNLSVGGMTTREKAVVVERATRVVQFDLILVGITLWDSLNQELRHPFDQLPEGIARANDVGKSGLDYWLDPSGINKAGQQMAWNLLERTSPFIRRRSAIQSWLEDLAMGKARSRPPASSSRVSAANDGAFVVQYDYGVGDRRQTVRKNVDALLRSLRAVKTRHARIAILLTPVRQDDRMPAYLPVRFYPRFARDLQAQCDAAGFELLDATYLLPPSHFGVYEGGYLAGKVDVLHFDAAGHKLLADFIAESLDLK